MIIDVTGIILTPGDNGDRCLGNGKHFDDDGKPLECCCDECGYFLCCCANYKNFMCAGCDDPDCPRIHPSEGKG